MATRREWRPGANGDPARMATRREWRPGANGDPARRPSVVERHRGANTPSRVAARATTTGPIRRAGLEILRATLGATAATSTTMRTFEPVARHLVALLATASLQATTAGCNAQLAEGTTTPPTRDHPDAPTLAADAAAQLAHLDAAPGTYRGACDGSAAVPLDATHFISFSDSDDHVRVYTRGATAAPDADYDLTAAFDGAGNPAVLEDAARIGDRIYVIGSHDRTSDGDQRPARFRLAAFDLVAGVPELAGMGTRLVNDMLDASRWTSPPSDVIATLAAATRLDQPTVPELAPKLSGLSIEGLARAPTLRAPSRLLIGLRNPRPHDHALVIELLNPVDVVDNNPARLGGAIELDLGGLGILAMTWSETLREVLLIAGPHDDAEGPYQLYRWSGQAGDLPYLITNLTVPPSAHPEAIVTYPNTTDMQILFDADNLAINGVPCELAEPTVRQFSDVIVRMD